jgi:hypothetical protein
MIKYIIFILLCLSNISLAKDQTNDILWHLGIAFRNGKAIYFDPDKLNTTEFTITQRFLTNQKKYYPIFPGGEIDWTSRTTNLVYIYSMPVMNYAQFIIKSQKIICYKVSNEAIYLKDEDTGWEKMDFRLIKQNPAPHIDFLIYLRSRWFEGEYEIYQP